MTRDEILTAIKNGEDMRGAYLHRADLSGTDLCGVNLCGASLSGAVLYNALLNCANLCGANLCDANLSNADLYCANLYGANLNGAVLHGTSLHGADGIVCAGYDRHDCRFVGVLHKDGWHVLASFHWFSMPEAKTYWIRKNNPEALARLAVIEAHTPGIMIEDLSRQVRRMIPPPQRQAKPL